MGEVEACEKCVREVRECDKCERVGERVISPLIWHPTCGK